MKTAICTLFEGHYHYGVAALVNSLYYQGYRGEVFAGYRGELPFWSEAAKENLSLQSPGARTLEVAEGVQLHFIPLDTDHHLTNYKPDFLLRLWDGDARNADAILYFDPDIVVTASWGALEDWIINCGVALCEDVNSPLSKNHPCRLAWRKYFGKNGVNLCYKESIYANGGFVGVSKKNINFISTWKKLQDLMAPAIGGLNRSQFNNFAALPEEAKGPFAPFAKTDQDALNATVEAWEGDVSFAGQEGMAFKPGTHLMPHALGPSKPWITKPLIQALAGRTPRVVDSEYWNNANDPIKTQPKSLIFCRKIEIKMAAFIGRFYKRG